MQSLPGTNDDTDALCHMSRDGGAEGRPGPGHHEGHDHLLQKDHE